MKNSYVTYLGSDDFLPGVLVLAQSIKAQNMLYELIIIVNKTFVSNSVIETLRVKGFKILTVDNIENPSISKQNPSRYNSTYTKLKIFDLIEFEKIVYLDADMMVCSNLDVLFDYPSLSAVISGSLINKSWKDLNSGLLVICPDRRLFNDIISKTKILPSNDGGDQGLLQVYFPDWKDKDNLHLDHKYNVPFCYMNEYCSDHKFIFKYRKSKLNTNISIIHFWGNTKPWHINLIPCISGKNPANHALAMWYDLYEIAVKQTYN